VIEKEEEKGKDVSVQEITSDPHIATNTGLGTNFTYERETNLLTDDDRQASLTIPCVNASQLYAAEPSSA
jgi:hypothetical protein